MATTVDPFILQRVERACALRATSVRVEMGRGVPALATISSTAALIGSLGMALGIFGAFVSSGSSRSAILAAITDRLSRAMLPFLFGLAVSIFAFCTHRYLQSRLQNFYLEMQSESSVLTDCLRLLLRQGGIRTPLHGGKWLSAGAGSPRPVTLFADRIYRHGVLELLWPKVRVPVDVHCALNQGMWILFAYAAFGALGYWNQRRPVSALIVAAYFACAAMKLRFGSKAALAVIVLFCALASAICIVSSGVTLTPACLALAPLPLLGSMKAVRRASDGITVPTFRWLSNLALLPLAASALLVVSYGTVLRVESVTDESMAPTLHEDDFLVSLDLRFGRSIRNDEVLRVQTLRGAGRVAAMTGDHIRIAGGQLFRNGRPVPEPFGSGAPNEDFPLPDSAYDDGFARWQHQVTYGDNLDQTSDFVVPSNTYFLLNDNLHDLEDSRIFGPLPLKSVLGKPVLAFRRTNAAFPFSVRLVR